LFEQGFARSALLAVFDQNDPDVEDPARADHVDALAFVVSGREARRQAEKKKAADAPFSATSRCDRQAPFLA